MFKSVNAKLGNMRKEEEFTIYPRKEGDNLILQSDSRICIIDTITRKGMLSKRCQNPVFIMATRAMGATQIEVAQEIIDASIG